MWNDINAYSDFLYQSAEISRVEGTTFDISAEEMEPGRISDIGLPEGRPSEVGLPEGVSVTLTPGSSINFFLA